MARPLNTGAAKDGRNARATVYSGLLSTAPQNRVSPFFLFIDRVRNHASERTRKRDITGQRRQPLDDGGTLRNPGNQETAAVRSWIPAFLDS